MRKKLQDKPHITDVIGESCLLKKMRNTRRKKNPRKKWHQQTSYSEERETNYEAIFFLLFQSVCVSFVLNFELFFIREKTKSFLLQQ